MSVSNIQTPLINELAKSGKRFRLHALEMNKSHSGFPIHHRRQKSWGIEGYYAQNNDWHFYKPKTFWPKGKKENFMETEARKKKELPAPTAYKMKSEWSGQYSDGGGHSGKWLKGPKVTLIDDILKLRKLKLPGPGQ